MNRRDSSATSLIAYISVFFGAIPVALAFRSIAQHSSPGSAAADLVGQSSLAAFLLGVIAAFAMALIVRRIEINRYVTGTLNALETKTAVFDATGLTVTGQISEAKWQWAAISRFTRERDLFLFWIGRTAVVIPCRSFASASASTAAEALIRARLADVVSSPTTAM